MIRAMSPDEEVNLAMAVTCREIMGEPASIDLAKKMKLPDDLIDLLRAGLMVEEIDREMEGEDIEPGESGYRYVWTVPFNGGQH